MHFFGPLICWWYDAHVPKVEERMHPRRQITICDRCGELLDEDPWDDNRDEPPVAT